MATITNKKQEGVKAQKVDITVTIKIPTNTMELFGFSDTNPMTDKQIVQKLTDKANDDGQDIFWYLYDLGYLINTHDPDDVDWEIDINTTYTGERKTRSVTDSTACSCGEWCPPGKCYNVAG